MSYTPGPWYASKGPDKSIIYQDAKPKQDIAAVWRHENANLLAAAPELLEALEEIIASNPSILATERSALRYVQAVEKARKVIGKARGEE